MFYKSNVCKGKYLSKLTLIPQKQIFNHYKTVSTHHFINKLTNNNRLHQFLIMVKYYKHS